MHILNRWSAKRRAKEVFSSLAGMASAEAITEEFRAASALVRAYGVALGVTVPEHTTRILFADKIAYFDEAWKLDDSRIVDLASYLSWTQTKGAFQDMETLAESADQAEQMRSMLMTVTGRVFPASERAMAIMHDLADALDISERQQALMESGAFLDKEHPEMGLHFKAVAQVIDKPWNMNEVEPATIYEAQRFLTLLNADATTFFRRRALEIFKAHVQHGIRPI
jgi:hypothetical protein